MVLLRPKILKKHQPGSPCDAKALIDAFRYACIKLVFGGIANASSSLCAAMNGTEFFVPFFGVTGDPWSCSSLWAIAIEDQESNGIMIGFIRSTGTVWVSLDCQEGGILVDAIFDVNALDIGACIAQFGYVTPGPSTPPEGSDPFATTVNAIIRLARGETVRLPLLDMSADNPECSGSALTDCNFTNSYVDVSLVSFGLCDGSPSNAPAEVCATIFDCSVAQTSLDITGFEDCNIVNGDHIERWTRSNMNGQYGPMLRSTNPPVPCDFLPGHTGVVDILYYMYTGDPGNYNYGGIQWRWDDYSDVFHRAAYVAAVHEGVCCRQDEKIFLKYMAFLIYEYDVLLPEPPPDVSVISGSDWEPYGDPYCEVFLFDDDDPLGYTKAREILSCSSWGSMSTLFHYDKCGTDELVQGRTSVGPVD